MTTTAKRQSKKRLPHEAPPFEALSPFDRLNIEHCTDASTLTQKLGSAPGHSVRGWLESKAAQVYLIKFIRKNPGTRPRSWYLLHEFDAVRIKVTGLTFAQGFARCRNVDRGDGERDFYNISDDRAFGDDVGLWPHWNPESEDAVWEIRESEAAYLERHGELTPAEVKRWEDGEVKPWGVDKLPREVLSLPGLLPFNGRAPEKWFDVPVSA